MCCKKGDLLVALQDKSDHQSQEDSFCGNPECLYNISQQAFLGSFWDISVWTANQQTVTIIPGATLLSWLKIKSAAARMMYIFSKKTALWSGLCLTNKKPVKIRICTRGCTYSFACRYARTNCGSAASIKGLGKRKSVTPLEVIPHLTLMWLKYVTFELWLWKLLPLDPITNRSEILFNLLSNHWCTSLQGWLNPWCPCPFSLWWRHTSVETFGSSRYNGSKSQSVCSSPLFSSEDCFPWSQKHFKKLHIVRRCVKKSPFIRNNVQDVRTSSLILKLLKKLLIF